MRLVRITADYPYDLLLLADETVESIDRYLHRSDVCVAKLEGREEPVGVCCLCPVDEKTNEIKNIAVATAFQHRGIGTSMMQEIERVARENGYAEIIVGTAECGAAQMRFYRKNGYRKYGVRKNFFLDNYDEPIFENGARLIDMVMLRKEIGG